MSDGVGWVMPKQKSQDAQTEQVDNSSIYSPHPGATSESENVPARTPKRVPVYSPPDENISKALLSENGEVNESVVDVKSDTEYNMAPSELAEEAKWRTFYKDETGEMKRIDYVLVYHAHNPENMTDDDREKEQFRTFFEQNLQEKGVEIDKIQQRPGDGVEEENELIFVRCHAPDDLLTKWAEILRMRMPLRMMEADSPIKKNIWGRLWEAFPSVFEPYDFQDDVEDKYNPYCYFTAIFTEARMDRFALKEMGIDNFFTVADRNRIMHHILSRTEYGSYETNNEEQPDDFITKKIGVDNMVQDGGYTDAYPLHDGPYVWDDIAMGAAWTQSGKLMNERQKLYYSWGYWKTWYKKQPMERIRRYFGEKIALYFAWLGFYTYFLAAPALLGVLCFLYGLVTMGQDAIADEVCDGGIAADYDMCPRCDKGCDPWKLGEACTNVRVAHLFDNNSTIVFAVVMALWGTLFLEFWKRKQNELGYEWDLFDYETGMQMVRPQFELKARKAAAEKAKAKDQWWRMNPVTLMTEPFMPLTAKIPKLSASISTVMFMILVVIAAVVAVIMYRTFISFQINSSDSEDLRTYNSLLTTGTAAMLSLFIIQLLTRIYQKLAIFLTDFECPRTETEYEDSYTMKMFVFQFVNYYSAILYVAFFKGRFIGYPGHYNKIFGARQEECQPGGCLMEVTMQLGVVMVGKQIMNNCMEILLPVTKAWWQRRQLANSDGGNAPSQKKRAISQWQADYCLMPQPPLNLFYEYLEMVIQFGFTTLFVAAFPLAPFFAFLNNVIEIKLDAYKFVTQNRRPWAEKAEDIGSWFQILEGIAIIAVITNAMIIAFTSSTLTKLFYFWWIEDRPDSVSYSNFLISKANITSHYDEAVSKALPDGICWYQDFRSPADGPQPYELTKVYYELLAVRLAFVLIFENVVFAVKQLMAYLVPDMPGHVTTEKAREEYVTRQVLYDAEKKKYQAAYAVSQWKVGSTKANQLRHRRGNSTPPNSNDGTPLHSVAGGSPVAFPVNATSVSVDV